MSPLPASFDPFATHPFTNGSGVVSRPPPPHAYALHRPDHPLPVSYASGAPPPSSPPTQYPASPPAMHMGSPPGSSYMGSPPASSYMGSPSSSSYMGSPPMSGYASSPPTSYTGSPPPSSGFQYPSDSRYPVTSGYPTAAEYPSAPDAKGPGRALAPSFMRATPVASSRKHEECAKGTPGTDSA
ncbi:hypothetical protein BD626DRAFT_570547 [Schizophyllum amplum]|uniref:Uncharacterized protein n=1 Tax=Schizophyllum amplum TaxID=97359 RepID=A0A550CAK5_9AGAR|nr:hypothetical protein BD626DRAFT_570547 [Auriculariopsis ampla]